MSLSLREQK